MFQSPFVAILREVFSRRILVYHEDNQTNAQIQNIIIILIFYICPTYKYKIL
jgi:hypothetical protein